MRGHRVAVKGGFLDEERAQLDPEGWVSTWQMDVGEHSRQRI